MVISKIKMLGTFGFTAAAVGGLVYQYRSSSGPPTELESSSELQQRVLDLLEDIQRLQTSEQTAHDRAAAAEVSSRQLAQEAQELQDSRDAAVALQQQLEQALQQSCHLAEAVRETASSHADPATQHIPHKLEEQESSPVSKHSVAPQASHLAIQGRVRRAELEREKVAHNAAELRTSFAQAQLSHTTVVHRLRQQLQNAVEAHRLSQGRLEGQLAAEKQAHSAVSKDLAAEQQACSAVRKDLVAAQREMEGLVRRNQELELELANANLGEEARQAQVEQQEMRANLEAQPAELTSVKAELAARDADMAALQEQADHLQSQLQASNGQLHDARRAEEASLERMRRDAEQHAADMAAVKEKLLAQAAEKHQAIGDLQEQVARLQDQVARAEVAPSPTPEAAARLQMEVGALQQQLSSEHNLMVEAQSSLTTTQKESQQYLPRAETAESQVQHVQDDKLSLSTNLADVQQQLPALQSQLQEAAEGKQSATATAERLGGQVETLQGEVAELRRQLAQQSNSQVACKALEKAQGRAEGLRQQLQAAVAAQQLAEGNLVEITTKLAASDKMLKLISSKRKTGSSRKSELKKQRSDLQLYVCLKLKAGLQKEIAQGCYLAKQVELLKTQLVSAGLEPASAEQPDDGHDALSLSDLDLTVDHGGHEDEEVTTPQSWGSQGGSPHIGAAWGNLDVGASCSSDVAESLQPHNEDASGVDHAASSLDAGSSACASSTADALEGGAGGFNSKEDGWETVQRKMRKGKASWDGLRQVSKSTVRRSGDRGKSRLGNV
ncbi:hypothetical protein WJX82_001227 [Trebouxia sp. C0006]